MKQNKHIIITHIRHETHLLMKLFRYTILFFCCLLFLTAWLLHEKTLADKNAVQDSSRPSRVLKGSIIGPFVTSARNAGLTNNQIHKVANMFRGRIDFRRDLRHGGTFKVLFDKPQNDEAKILAVVFTINGSNLSAFRNTDGNFYDENANSLNGRDERQFLAKVREYKRLLLNSNVLDSESSSENNNSNPIWNTDIFEELTNVVNEIKNALGRDIQIVQESKMAFGNNTMTIQEWVGALVGIRGTANWSEFVTSENIHIVQLDLSRKIKDKDNKASIQWMVNPDTKYIKMSYLGINGESKPKYIGIFELSVWAAESMGESPQ